jgi:YVTN family beta-propeller protein
MTRRFISVSLAAIMLLLTLAACGDDASGAGSASNSGNTNNATGSGAAANPCSNGNLNAATADQLCHATPQGRVYVADQLADKVSVIDVATNQAYTSIPTGSQPHHVAVNPANTEVWVTLYGETFMQVFALSDNHQIAKIDLANDRSDDLVFTPDGKLLFTSLGNGSQVAVIDTASYKLIKKIGVGNTPHGIRVRPDGKEIYVTNTLSNDVSVIDVAKLAVIATIANVGATPFEVSLSNDGSKAYVSNFSGSSIAVIDTATHTRTAIWRTGQQPAMVWISADDKTLYVASTGEGKLIVMDTTAKGKMLHHIDSGQETHGVVQAGDKLYTTNIKDNTVTVIDPATDQVITTITVGNAPNGLAYTPYKGPGGS